MRAVAEILASLGAPRLVVVGDLLLDRYLSGVVNRISPEAPVQILRVEEETERLGGAGSVAVNVGVLGASTVLLGVVGQDVAGDRVGQLAAAGGVELDTVVEDGRRTSVKTRHVARSHTSAQQVLRVDQETVGPVEASTEAAIRARLETRLPHADAVLLSDYGKGVLTPTLIAWILERCRAQGIPAVVDPKGRDFQRYRGAAGLTPNRPETIVATGIEIGDGDLAAAERAACALVGALDLDFALVTLDREGMYLKVSDSPGRHLATTPREVFDVTGAGDMVISVLAVALASGASPEEAATLANVAAGLEVEHLGVVPVTREEIAARLAL
ncbi:MAG: bifunctional heptose 7-phosphate kinase/heptose 1-phosphate adenyltransferase, partial [Planctomycetota bacterium]